MRDRTAAQGQYEGLWSRTRECVDREIARGVREIGPILDAIQAQSWEWFKNRYFREVFADVGIAVRGDALATRLAVRDGKYQVVPFDSRQADLPVRLAAFIAEHGDIEHVVELGSGYGHNLFRLHDELTPEQRGSLKLHACELSSSGREVTSRLHALDPAIALSVHPFDYYKPDFSFLAGAKATLVFSSHSIEQIPVLGEELFRDLLSASPRCYGIHAEPVGWQYEPALVDEREARSQRKPGALQSVVKKVDGLVYSALGLGLVELSAHDGIEVVKSDLGTAHNLSLNAARWSARADYNKNLVALLRQLTAENVLRITAEQIHAYGDNPFNPSTIICWAAG